MTTIAVAIDRFDGVLTLSAAIDFGSLPAPITIDSEALLVTGGDNQKRISVNRGMNGTAPASHALNATVTEGWSTGGSGGVIVDNTVDAPSLTSSMTIPGAVLAGSDADLTSIVTILQRTVTLTDAQIKALPGTSIELVADIPGKIIIPILAIIQTNVVTGYTGIAGTAQLFLGNGGTPIILADEGAASEEAFVSTFLGSANVRYGIALPRVEYIGAPGNAFGMLGAIGVAAQVAPGDGALYVSASNGGGNPALTGGNAANTCVVIVWYGTIDRPA